MTAKTITTYFSLLSPWAYFGHAAFVDLARKYHLAIDYRPVFLGEIFAATGGLPLAQRPQARKDYRILELQRWREKRGITLNIHPKFWPFDVKLADKTVLALMQEGHDPAAFISAAYHACWAQDENLADAATLAKLLESVGLDPNLVEVAQFDAAQKRYVENVKMAIEAGAFGSPTYIWQGEVFWGQDRLDLLEDALKSGRAAYGVGA